MSDLPDGVFAPDLLDLHLGRLSDEQTKLVMARIEQDPALAEQHDVLLSVFAALESVRREPIPDGVADRIAGRVATSIRRVRVIRPPSKPDDDADAASAPLLIPFRGMREIIAVAAMIVLAVGLGIPGLLSVRERGQRIACSAQLAGIGQGLQTYAAGYNNSLPFAGWDEHKTWAMSENPADEIMPNRRHLYRLVRGHYTSPNRFVCPSRMHVPMPDDKVGELDDFPEANNVSFAYQNMAKVRPSLDDNADLPILADDNPLFDDGIPVLGLLRQGFNAASGNSTAHRGQGQNILSLSGHVRWTTTPLCGFDGDNIWTLQDVESYTGREGPASTRDAHMLK